MRIKAKTFSIFAFLLAGCIGPHLSRPLSDVPVITDIGWWTSEGIHLESLEVQALEAPLNVLNYRALIRFNLKGTLQAKREGWRPYIRATHVSERFVMDDNGEKIGDIELTPVIGYKKDKEYKGSEIPFHYKIEKLVETYRWGINRGGRRGRC
jgi:hypothetical protein